jgi:hypothetical protein
VSAENLGSTPLAVELSERIPVAETAEIEISGVELPRKVKPAAHGVVRWTETIAPHAKAAWRIGYKLDYPTDLAARARVADEHRPVPTVATPAQPAPQNLYNRIHALEATL